MSSVPDDCPDEDEWPGSSRARWEIRIARGSRPTARRARAAARQHLPPQDCRHVSMMAPVELRMTALHSTVHPTEETSVLHAEIAVPRSHPDCVQSVPIDPGASQKLRVTWHAAGVSASEVMPSGSAVASLDDAGDASGVPGAETSASGVGESTLQANRTTA